MRASKKTNRLVPLFVSVLLALTACGGGGSDSPSAQEKAIEKITAYASDSSNPAPTLQDFIDAGVTGVTNDNLDELNTVVDGLEAKDVDTTEELDALTSQLGINIKPTANAGEDKTVQVNQSIALTGTGADTDGTVTDYEWKVGSTVLATTATFDYTPTTVGTDTLTFKVTDNDGDSVSDTVDIVVTAAPVPNQAPTADAGVDKSVEVNQTISIVGTATDIDGSIASVEWKIGSAVLASTATFDYTPTTVGTDTLTFKVTDNDGDSASDTVDVVVTAAPVPNQAPTADAGADKSVEVHQTISIVGTATDIDGSIASVEWKIGSAVLASTATFDYTPTTVGTNTLTFKVTDNDGDSVSDTVDVVVTAIPDATPPVITILGDNPITVQQGDAYTDAGATAVDDVDGNVAVSDNSTVDTSTAGEYAVTYTASDGAGNTTTETRTVNVTAATVSISGKAVDDPIVGGNVVIKAFSGATLGTGVTSDDGSYSIQVNEGDIASGYEVIVTGGKMAGVDFTDELRAIYSASDAKDRANVTLITTLIDRLSLESESGLSITKRDQVLQKLSDMGLLKKADWFELNPSFVDMYELRATVQHDGISSWLDGIVADLENDQLGRDKMRVFHKAHGGLLRAYTSNRVFVYPGDTKTVVVIGESSSSLSDNDVSISFIGEHPNWVTIVNNTLVVSPLDTQESLQTINLNINVTKGGIVVGRILSFDISLLKKVVLLEGDIGIAGGTLLSEWNDISLRFNSDVLESEHHFTLSGGLNTIGAISTKLIVEPPLSDGEQTGLHLSLPVKEVLRSNYFTVNNNQVRSSRNASRNVQQRTIYYNSNLLSHSTKKICIDNEIKEMSGFIFNNIWRASTNNYDNSFLTGVLNGGEPRSINGIGVEKCSTRLWSISKVAEASLLASTKEPVLLVHGFISSGKLGSMDGSVYFANFAQVLNSTNKYVPFEFEWRTNASFTDVAVDLRRSIEMIAKKTGKQVHIVAHSFGGVLTRSMVQLGFNSKLFSEKFIASISTVGSPHSGIFDSTTIRDKVFQAKIDNTDRSFTFGTGSIAFPRGQDGFAGSLIDGCRAITCYQAGDSVTFLNNDSAHNKYGVLNESGSIVYRLASTLSDYPDVPTQVLIGLVSDSQIIETAGAGRVGKGKLKHRFVPRLGNMSGDNLISDNGQRVEPFGTGVYQGEITSKNNIEEHVLHLKLVDDESKFNRTAYDKLLEVFDKSTSEENFSINEQIQDGYYDFNIIKDSSENSIFVRENELVDYATRYSQGYDIIYSISSLIGKYVTGSNHRTGQYNIAGNPILPLAMLSEVGLQDCATSLNCRNPTWLYFKTFAEAHPAEAISLPEVISLTGNVFYIGPVNSGRSVQRSFLSSSRDESVSVVPFPVTIEAYTGDIFSIFSANGRTTLNDDGTYELNVPYQPDTKYTVIAYPEGDTFARIGAHVRASASKFLRTFSTLEESTLHFPTITLSDGNYQEGNLTIRVTDGTSGVVLNGFEVNIINSNQITVDNQSGIDAGYVSTQAKGDYTVKITKEGYNNGEDQCTVVADENTDCIINIVSDTHLANGEITAVLSWGVNPSDLDSHLIRKTNGVQDYHIYFGSKTGVDANLDRDDTDSIGPETVTINVVSRDSTYTYYVYNYSGGAGNVLPNSDAKVELNFEGGQRTFYVPSEEGRFWKVFDIKNGRIIPCTEDCVKNDTSTFLRRGYRGSRHNNELRIFKNLPLKNHELH